MEKSRVEQVRDDLIAILKEEGSMNINQLITNIGCGKSTFYKAIEPLKQSGKVRIKEKSSETLVTLVRSVPKYMKIMVIISILLFWASYLEITQASNSIIHFGTQDISTSQNIVLFPGMLGFLVGVWGTLVILKTEDFEEAIAVLKSHITGK